MNPDRKDILLRAAYDMLRRAIDAPFVLSVGEMQAYYDEAICDGSCLMCDIAAELDISEYTEPLPLIEE